MNQQSAGRIASSLVKMAANRKARISKAAGRRFAASFGRELSLEGLERRAMLNAGNLLVQLQPGAESQFSQLSALAAADHATIKSSSILGLYEVDADATVSANLEQAFKQLSFVKYAEPEATMHAALTPNDPSFTNGTLWGMNGANGINAPTAWDSSTGSSKVVVADIDSGMDYNHPDLYENVWLNQAEIPASRKANLVDFDNDGIIDFHDLNDTRNQGAFKINDVNGDGRIDAADVLAPMQLNAQGADSGAGGWSFAGNTLDGDTAHPNDFVGWNFVANTNNPFDDNGHGTHTAGTIGAMGNNGVGVVGVNWNVEIMPLKFLDSTGSGSDLDAASAIQYSADHGAKVSNNSWGGSGGGTTLYNAINYAASKGDLFVAAAGNSGANTDTTPNYPSGYNLPNIIAVAAIDSSGNLASFSNYGATSVDLAAPGVGITSTLPNNSYASWSGTSMATPHVSGAAALLLSLHPDWSYQQLSQALLNNVDPMSSLSGKVAAGGRLDIGKAVQNSAPSTTTPTSEWASSVIAYSSQYSSGNWSAAKALGAPNVTSYGDYPSAWTASSKDGTTEFLTLGYTTPVYANGVTVRETNGNGFVTKIEVRNSSTGAFETVWSGTDPSAPGTPVSFNVSFTQRSYLVDAVRVTIDTSHSTTWEEVDAVELDGAASSVTPPPPPPPPPPSGTTSEWAASVIAFSSQYSSGNWSAAQALGAPNVTSYGDYPNAWTASSKDGTTEFLTLGYTTPLYANGVTVRESNGNGFVTKVEVRNASTGAFETVWSGTDPSAPGTPVNFNVSFTQRTYLVDAVRVTINTSHSTAWEEVDAIGLSGNATAAAANLVNAFASGSPAAVTPSGAALQPLADSPAVVQPSATAQLAPRGQTAAPTAQPIADYAFAPDEDWLETALPANPTGK